MAKTNYLEEALLNHVLRNTAYTSPAGVYVALFTESPTETGSLTNELSGDGYARQAVTFGAPTQEGGPAQVANTAEVVFPAATDAWPEATHWAVVDAATTGNVLYYALLLDANEDPQPRTILQGDQLRFAVGELRVRES